MLLQPVSTPSRGSGGSPGGASGRRLPGRRWLGLSRNECLQTDNLLVRHATGWERLEARGMVQANGLIKPAGKGVFVVAEFANPLNHSLHLLLTLRETDLRELFEVRKILEGETAALAAARRTDEDLAQMERAIVEMVEGLAAQDWYIEADLRFHLTIAAATRNRIALRMMQAVRDLLQRALSIYHIPGSPQRSIEQHRLI